MLTYKIIFVSCLSFLLTSCGGQSAKNIISGKSALQMPGGIRISGFEAPHVKYERRNEENQSNLRGSPYDQGVQISTVGLIGQNSSGFLAPLTKGGGSRSSLSTNVLQRNHSIQNAPAFYRKRNKIVPIIRKALIANGLWYNKSTGLLSKAPYEIRVAIIDYYDERYIQDKNAVMRAVDFLINEDNRRYTKEILAQGFYSIRTSYHIELIDRASNKAVYTKKLRTSQKVKVVKDSNWKIHEGKKASHGEMMRRALQTAFDEFLPART